MIIVLGLDSAWLWYWSNHGKRFLKGLLHKIFYQGLMRALWSCPPPPAPPTSTCSVRWLCRWSFRSELWRSGTVFDPGFSAAAWTRSWRLQMSGREIFSLVKGWENPFLLSPLSCPPTSTWTQHLSTLRFSQMHGLAAPTKPSVLVPYSLGVSWLAKTFRTHLRVCELCIS